MQLRTTVLFLALLTGTCAMLSLQGCQVNVVMLDGVNIDTSPYNYIEAQLPDVAVYDCEFAPAADECQ